jgi:hypothetical protein
MMMSYKMDSIDKLLLREYIGICKCTGYDIIEGIISDIDQNNLDQYGYTSNSGFNGISKRYNIPKDKVIIIKDIASRYRPNHRAALLGIYNQYYDVVRRSKSNIGGGALYKIGGHDITQKLIRVIDDKFTNMEEQIIKQIDPFMLYISSTIKQSGKHAVNR